MTENFPNLVKEKVTQIKEAQSVPLKKNPNRPTPRHTKIKMAKFKDKERILKVAKVKTISYPQGVPIR